MRWILSIYYGSVWDKVFKKSKKGGRYPPCNIGLVVGNIGSFLCLEHQVWFRVSRMVCKAGGLIVVRVLVVRWRDLCLLLCNNFCLSQFPNKFVLLHSMDAHINTSFKHEESIKYWDYTEQIKFSTDWEECPVPSLYFWAVLTGSCSVLSHRSLVLFILSATWVFFFSHFPLVASQTCCLFFVSTRAKYLQLVKPEKIT